jgi:hypothetical protein
MLRPLHAQTAPSHNKHPNVLLGRSPPGLRWLPFNCQDQIIIVPCTVPFVHHHHLQDKIVLNTDLRTVGVLCGDGVGGLSSKCNYYFGGAIGGREGG